MTSLERLPVGSAPPPVRRLEPRVAAVPAVFDSPHSGLLAPADFTPVPPLRKLFGTADAYVDELFEAAPQHGAVLIAATFPRCYIDVNRGLEQLDPVMIDDASGVGTQVMAGDLNGDGKPDVVVGNKLGTFVSLQK